METKNTVVKIAPRIRGLRAPMWCACGELLYPSYKTKTAYFPDGIEVRVYYVPSYECVKCGTDRLYHTDNEVFEETVMHARNAGMSKVIFEEFTYS